MPGKLIARCIDITCGARLCATLKRVCVKEASDCDALRTFCEASLPT